MRGTTQIAKYVGKMGPVFVGRKIWQNPEPAKPEAPEAAPEAPEEEPAVESSDEATGETPAVEDVPAEDSDATDEAADSEETN